MTNNALFGDNLQERLRESGRLGLQLYGSPVGQFVGDDALARGYEALRAELPPQRLDLVMAELGNSYGAWNPTVLFLGLAAGSRPPPRPLTHQHGVGCPDFFEREPGARGIWLAKTVKEITIDAFRQLGAHTGFSWLNEWEAQRPAEFLSATGGAAAVLNLSLEAVRMGGHVALDQHSARRTLLEWLRGFRPSVVVNLKPDVAKTLVSLFPDCGLASHVGTSPTDEARVAIAQFEDVSIPVITMPLHPTALGKNIPRMKASKPRISRAIAAALAGTRAATAP